MNILVSPARITSILAFLSHFTDEETKERIRRILSITDDDVIRYLTKDSLLPSNNYGSWSSEEYRKLLTIENSSSIWIDSTISTSDFFDAVSKEWGYEKVVTSLCSDETKQRIKNYVKMYTNGMIKNMNVDFSPSTKAVLVDCLYFKGKWRMTFDTSDTKPDVFYSTNSEKIVPFMKVRLRFGDYYSCRTFQAIELKYRCYCEDRSYSMRIYLPNENKSCEDILRILQKRGSGIEFKTKPIILSMPKFNLSKEEKLSDVLKNIGVDIAKMKPYIFKDNSESLMINDIIQQGSFKVTEKGTEAGVSTYMSLILGRPRKIHYKEMKVNRPFIFEIVEKHSGLRLFAGVVNKI
jgi:serine protease inhibitor